MNENLKIARLNKQVAMMNTAKDIMFNPAVELLLGLVAIEALYPKSAQSPGTMTVTERKTNYGNPLWFIQELFGSKSTTTTTLDLEASQEQFAKNALMWVIIAQQLAPYTPSIVQGATSGISGIAGLLTKGKE
jgi:hypothetical protein